MADLRVEQLLTPFWFFWQFRVVSVGFRMLLGFHLFEDSEPYLCFELAMVRLIQVSKMEQLMVQKPLLALLFTVELEVIAAKLVIGVIPF